MLSAAATTSRRAARVLPDFHSFLEAFCRGYASARDRLEALMSPAKAIGLQTSAPMEEDEFFSDVRLHQSEHRWNNAGAEYAGDLSEEESSLVYFYGKFVARVLARIAKYKSRSITLLGVPARWLQPRFRSACHIRMASWRKRNDDTECVEYCLCGYRRAY